MPQEISLHVRQMRVIWRDTFVVEAPPPDFLAASRQRLIQMPLTVSDTLAEPVRAQPDALRVIERVSRNVAGIGYGDLLRFQLAPFEMANLRPTLARLRRSPGTLSDRQIRDAAAQADDERAWITVTPMLLLHRAGVGIVQYHATIDGPGPGLTPDEAIEVMRLGYNFQLLNLPDSWRATLPAELPDARTIRVLKPDEEGHLAVFGLRDLSQYVVASRLNAPERSRRQRKRAPLPARIERPTGSTTAILVETDPQPGGDLRAFVAEYAVPLRGIGALDTFYRERASWIVERELTDNLSADREMGVYLLGNSELILYNDEVGPILEETRSRLGLPDTEHAATYHYMHYGVLLEWVYLQEAILRTYLQRLDELAAAPAPRRRDMIGTLQGALADLIQYQENITPFATRVEFLERARQYHKLDQLAERFERKQELILYYASEFHDYRDARATQFLNWLAGILTGAALADLIVTLAGITPQQTSLYLGITLGSILLVLAALAALLRFL
jgi:hypothetical protein